MITRFPSVTSGQAHHLLTACYRHHILFQKIQARQRSCQSYLPWRPWTFQSSSSNTEHSGPFCLILFRKKKLNRSGGRSKHLGVRKQWSTVYFCHASPSVFFSILVKSCPPLFRRSCKKLKQTQLEDLISFKCQLIYTFLIIKHIFQHDYILFIACHLINLPIPEFVTWIKISQSRTVCSSKGC